MTEKLPLHYVNFATYEHPFSPTSSFDENYVSCRLDFSVKNS